MRRGASSRLYSVSVTGPCCDKKRAAWRFSIVPTYSLSLTTSSVFRVRQPIKRPPWGSSRCLSSRISRMCSREIELLPASQNRMDGWLRKAMMTSRISSTRWSHWRPKLSFSLSPAGWVQTMPQRSNARTSAGLPATCIKRMWLALLSRMRAASSSCSHSGAMPMAAHSLAARWA